MRPMYPKHFTSKPILQPGGQPIGSLLLGLRSNTFGKNRSKPASFHDPRADYVHPPNGHEGNTLDYGVRQNPVRADSTRLPWKIV